MMVFYFLKVEKISSSFTLLYKKSVSLIETIKNDRFLLLKYGESFVYYLGFILPFPDYSPLS